MLVGDADLLLKSNFLVLKLAEAVLEQKCLVHETHINFNYVLKLIVMIHFSII